MYRGILLALAIVGVIGVAPAQGQLVVSNLGQSYDFNYLPSLSTEMQTSFTTGLSGPLTLDFITLGINTSTGALGGGGTWTAHLRLDNLGSPGAEVATSDAFVSGPIAPFSNVQENIQLEFVNFALSANTTYWLGVTRTEDSGVSTATRLTASTSETISNFGWTIGNDSFGNGSANGVGPMMFSVTAVPEPGTYSLLIVGGVVGFWMRRRKLAQKIAG